MVLDVPKNNRDTWFLLGVCKKSMIHRCNSLNEDLLLCKIQGEFTVKIAS